MSDSTVAFLGALILSVSLAVQADEWSGDFCFSVNPDGNTATVTGYGGTGGDVTIPDALDGHLVTAIGPNCFCYRTDLTSVSIPSVVTTIGEQAFYYCLFMTAADLPADLKQVGDSAFSWCLNLSSIAVPNGVVDIGNSAFYNCQRAGTITIGSSVTNIGDSAFLSCQSVQTIVIPDSVLGIGAGAFANCGNLSKAAIGTNVTTIGEGAFRSTDIAHVSIPASVTVIGDEVFRDCYNLYTVLAMGDAPTFGGPDVFTDTAGCYGATFYYLPSRTGWEATHSDSTPAAFELPPFTFTINEDDTSTITGYTGTEKNVIIPHDIAGYAVAAIGVNAFGSCTNLSGVTFLGDVASLGDRAFNGCTNLVTVLFLGETPALGTDVFPGGCQATVYYLPAVASLDTTYGGLPTEPFEYSYNFNPDSTLTILQYTGNATDLAIPRSVVTCIGEWAFYNRSSLTRVAISEGVTNIGDYAFYSCPNLAQITLPESLESIGKSAFGWNTNLASVAIPNSLSAIGEQAFWGCHNLSRVMIGSHVTAIGAGAFEGTGLAGVTIPASVTEIDDSAFNSCSQLNGILFLGDAPLSMGSDVFAWTKWGATIYYLPGHSGWDTPFFAGLPTAAMPPFAFTVNGDNKATITGYTGTGGNVTIPDTIMGYSVTAIDSNAFMDCTSLISATFLGSVAGIGDRAFDGCKNLVSVLFLGDGDAPALGTDVFPDGCQATVYYRPSVTTLDATYGGLPTAPFAFNYTVNPDSTLTVTHYTGTAADVAIPRSIVTSIDKWTFYGCSGLTSVTIPNSVTNIGYQAFYECTSLTSATIPDGVISIGDEAFLWCSALTRVALPASIARFGSEVFADCEALTDITIADGLTAIGAGAFADCSNLTSLVIPQSVSYIGNGAFAYCGNLSEILFLGNAPILGNDAFLQIHFPATAYYMHGTTGWESISMLKTELPPFTFALGPANTATITGYLGDSQNAIVPGAIAWFAVTNIGSHAFYDRADLRTITVSNSVATIEAAAFGNCTNLTCVRFLGDAPILVGSDVFTNDSRTTVYFQPAAARWGAMYGGRPAEPFAFDYSVGFDSVTVTRYTGTGGHVTIPEVIDGCPVTAIGTSAFDGCTGLTGVTIPDGVAIIGSYAFRGCTGLTEVTLPASVTGVYDGAFYHCNSLIRVYGQGNAPYMGGMVFTGDNATIYYAYGATGWTTFEWFVAPVSELPPFTFSVNADSSVTITGYIGAGGDVTIPDTIAGYSVTNIAAHAFGGCATIRRVTVPASVATIEGGAFANCANLDVILFLGNPPALVGSDVFAADSQTVVFFVPGGTVWPLTYGGLVTYEAPPFTYTVDSDQKVTITSYTGTGRNVTITGTIAGHAVVGIASNAFLGCVGVTNVLISDSVAFIGNAAFMGCTGLTSVVLSKYVSSIGSNAFADCTALVSLTVPASVHALGDGAFSGCTSLFRILFEGNAPALGGPDVFAGDDLAMVFYMPGTAGWTTTRYGGLTKSEMPPLTYAISGDGAVTITGYTGTDPVAVIPSSLLRYPVTAVGTQAFRSNAVVRCVVVSASVTSIGDAAFADCASLISVLCLGDAPALGANVFDNDPVTIYYDPVANNWDSLDAALTKSALPPFGLAVFTEGVIAITGYTGSGGDLTIPNTIAGLPVVAIGSQAFQGCTALTSLTLPDSVTNVGSEAFYGCDSLSTVSFGTGLASIGDAAFAGCASLSEVHFAGDVPSLGTDVFDGNCYAWVYATYGTGDWHSTFGGRPVYLDYPQFTWWWNWTPEDGYDGTVYISSYLATNTTVTVPGDINGHVVTHIGSIAFQSCANLVGVTLPDSIVAIDDYAFTGCSGLTDFTIPHGVASIGEGAFNGCCGLTNLVIPNSVTTIGNFAFGSCTGLVCVAMSDHVERIGDQVFVGCCGLTDFTIPPSVTSIGNWTFASCTGFTHVTIPEGVTNIGDGAFDSCTSLTNITFPSSVASIGGYAFEGCTGLASFAIPNGVTSVAGSLLQSCTSLTNVVIPASVTSIGGYAFFNCSGLTNIVMPSGVTSIGSAAFSGCSGLTNLTIPAGVTSIGDYGTFQGCTGLTGLALPNGVTNIGYATFRYCPNLATVTVSDIVTNIGDYAFYGCTSLTNFAIPRSVITIGQYAFADCTALTGVTLRDQVNRIGYEAFGWCWNMTNLTISASVANIGDYAFYDCSSLKSILFQGNPPNLEGEDVFDFCWNAKAYYLSGTWDSTYGGLTTVLLITQKPVIAADANFGMHAGRFGFKITGAVGQSVVVEACTNLANPVWQPVATKTLTGGSSVFTDTDETPFAVRFYHVIAVP